VNIRGEVKSAMADFDNAMGSYIALSRRSPAEVVAQKGGQILMGNNNPPFPGLFETLKKLSPKEGAITQDRLSVLGTTARGNRRPVKIRPRSYKRAEDLLAGRKSALVSIARPGGKVSVRQVRYRKRGTKRITNRSNRGGIVRVNRRSDALAGSGDRLLNLVSLSIALELQYREQGRGYIAVSFLPKKYRSMLGKVRANIRRDADRYRQNKVDMNKALQGGIQSFTSNESMRNAKGDELGRVSFTTNGQGAALRIQGFTPPQERAEVDSAVAQVLHHVRADTMVYIDRKLARDRTHSMSKLKGGLR